MRCFNVIDDANREILHVEIDYTLKSRRVIWVLNHLMKRRDKPKSIRMDNGPEFIAIIMQEWCEANKINMLFIQPGKPTQNAFIERFNGSYRRGVLDAHIFQRIEQVREQTQIWMHDCNNHRPHDSLKRLPPVIYAEKFLSGVNPRKELQTDKDNITNLALS
jgi:putative transposase